MEAVGPGTWAPKASQSFFFFLTPKLLKVFGSICMRLGRGEKWLFLSLPCGSIRWFRCDIYLPIVLAHTNLDSWTTGPRGHGRLEASASYLCSCACGVVVVDRERERARARARMK